MRVVPLSCCRNSCALRAMRGEASDGGATAPPSAPACGGQRRHLQEEVHADRPEETEAGRKAIDVEPGLPPGAHVFDAVGERVGERESGRADGSPPLTLM